MSDKRIGEKIKKLMDEGKTHRQAVGAAMGMASEGRLGPRGGYLRKSNNRTGSRRRSR